MTTYPPLTDAELQTAILDELRDSVGFLRTLNHGQQMAEGAGHLATKLLMVYTSASWDESHRWVEEITSVQPVAPRGGPCCEHNPPQRQPGVTLAESAVVPA